MGHLQVMGGVAERGAVEDRCQVESEPHWSVSVDFLYFLF